MTEMPLFVHTAPMSAQAKLSGLEDNCSPEAPGDQIGAEFRGAQGKARV